MSPESSEVSIVHLWAVPATVTILDIYRTPIYTPHMTKEMREPTFLVLAALAGGKKHGYAIIRGVEELSNGEVELKAGTLYTMLDRLVFEDVIEAAGDEVVDGRLRRYYQLTGEGASLLAAESKRRMVVSKEALRRLRFVGGVA